MTFKHSIKLFFSLKTATTNNNNIFIDKVPSLKVVDSSKVAIGHV